MRLRGTTCIDIPGTPKKQQKVTPVEGTCRYIYIQGEIALRVTVDIHYQISGTYHQHYTTTLIDGKSAAENGYTGRRFKLPFYQNHSHHNIT
jgi:hypothetical protein